MSLEMAHKVVVPPQKNYVPKFLKQRYINSYYIWYSHMQVQRTASAGPHLLPVPGAIQDLHQSLQHQVIIPSYRIKQKWVKFRLILLYRNQSLYWIGRSFH